MKAGQVHWFSVLQFGLSALVIFFLWSGALLLSMVGISGVLIQDSDSITDPLPVFLMAATASVSGLLLLPSAYYSLWRILGWRTLDLRLVISRLHPALWIMVLPLVLLLGYWVSNFSNLVWLVLPLLHVLAVSLPIGWLLFLSVRGLPLGSPQRIWGVFASGMALAPTCILVLEGLFGLAFLLLGAVYLTSHPEYVDILTRLADWMHNTNPSPEALLQEIRPFLGNPAMIFLVLTFGALVVPMIEELLKPIGVWLLLGRKLTPKEGFGMGAISGGAYALIESLALTSESQEWITIMVARIGTATIHIFTSGLVGWALVQAWHRRRYALLGISYLAAVSIHGLWNALIILITFTVLASSQGLQMRIPYLVKFGQAAPIGLGFLVVGAFVALLFENHLVKRSTYSKDAHITG